MRVITLIFMILAFMIGGACAGVLFKNIENRMDGNDYSVVEKAQKQIDELKQAGIDVTKIDDPQAKASLELLEKVPPKWKVDYAGPLGMLVAFLAFVMVIVAFMKKEFIIKLSIIVGILGLLLWIISPDIPGGKYSGINPKTLSLIAFVGIAISSVCAFMSYKLYLKKTIVIA
ncbi:hypothetical protein [Chryseobacterium jejuense]|uniref:Uncharacterized protein n=1 Tax=Chryseobacterium jejuense TaxID=445960 RepID=A0A2X2XEI6_CHRJE|nr:hypothetical protein [Chryseobacterium jejuense]SDI13721.1 hypothetical protein SAMN05421542_0185 [Chryseobacterium jejuense]SQB46455.1 Uncharacterised protein [Chryseobacterium jejuense]